MIAAREQKSTPLAPPVVKIKPSTGWAALDLRELWEARELLYFLAWRDIKVRYKQTALGAAWAIIQPFFTMVVLLKSHVKVADEVWTVTALLHREQPARTDFTVEEIVERARREALAGPIRPGVYVLSFPTYPVP